MTADHQRGHANLRLRRRFALLGVSACVLVLAAASVYLVGFRARLIADESEVLALAAEVAADEIAGWWQSEAADSAALIEATGFAARVKHRIEDPADALEQARVEDRLGSEIRYHGFDEVAILTPDGTFVQVVGVPEFVLYEETEAAVRAAATTGEVVPAGPYVTADGSALVDWAAPLTLDAEGVIATAVMRSDVVIPWSGDLEDARSLGGVGGLAVYTGEGEASRALLDHRGALVAVDPDALPREAQSLVADRPIASTNLRVVAASDRAEVLAPLSTQYLVTAAAAALILLVLGLIARLQYTAMQIAAAEDRQAELEGLVAARTAELERMVVSLADADVHKDRFLARMSHDFRTPLNAIIGFSELLSREVPGPLNGEQARQLAMVADAGHQMLGLVNDVLDISAISAGGVTLTFGDVVVQDLIGGVASLLEPEASRKEVEITVQPAVKGLRIRTDEARLRQVLVNIVTNAVKYTDAGSVSIGAAHESRRVVITVRDTGRGIAEDDIPHLMDEFFRTRDSEPASGTGLGLPIADRLVRLLGGVLTVKSDLGLGTVVTIDLPVDSGPTGGESLRG